MADLGSPINACSISLVENIRNIRKGKLLTKERKAKHSLNHILCTILEGVYDNGSPLSTLRGTPHIVQGIWKLITDYWKSLIKISHYVPTPTGMAPGSVITIPQKKFLLKARHVKFPHPQDLYINMMPFMMERQFEQCRLPENLRSYWENLIHPLFDGNLDPDANQEEGKVCYLTIHESFVDHNQSQRRSGLHIDNPGRVVIEGAGKPLQGEQTPNESRNEGKGSSNARFYEHHWGMGINIRSNEVEGGIYMSSNVEKSCEVWDSQVQKDERTGEEIIGRNGDIEYLRGYLGNSQLMQSNTVYWITDRTPHESLPLEAGTYRQYFRLVTHQVSLWFEDHSTTNPLGVGPNPNITKIVRGSKFGDPSQLKVVEQLPMQNGDKETAVRA